MSNETSDIRLNVTVQPATRDGLIGLAGSERKLGAFLDEVVPKLTAGPSAIHEIGILLSAEIATSDQQQWSVAMPALASRGKSEAVRFTIPMLVNGNPRQVTGTLPAGLRGYDQRAGVVALSVALSTLAAEGWALLGAGDPAGRYFLQRSLN